MKNIFYSFFALIMTITGKLNSLAEPMEYVIGGVNIYETAEKAMLNNYNLCIKIRPESPTILGPGDTTDMQGNIKERA